MKTRVLIIGGGPGGYVAAIRAAQLGAEVTLVERAKIGGTCLNVGCVPTKALLDSAKIFYEAGNSAQAGIEGEPSLNWNSVMERKGKVISQLVGGVEGLLRINGVKRIDGNASFISKNTVNICCADGTQQKLSAEKIIIATGSRPTTLPIEGANSEFCIDSADVLSLHSLPESIVIVGGGSIGIEFATAFNMFGCKVTVAEAANKVLPGIDADMADRVCADLRGRGVEIMTSARIQSFGRDTQGSYCSVSTPSKGKPEKLYAEKMFICTGRKPVFDGLGLEIVGVKYGEFIQTDVGLRTNIDGIYAVGDCNGKTMLASAAMMQGTIAAENCMGAAKEYDPRLCPTTTFSEPEMAKVGLSEAEAQDAGIEYSVGLFPAVGNARSIVMNATNGAVKMICGKKYGEFLGAQIYGPYANELIAQCALALRLEADSEELIGTIYGHPTLSECIHEAALATENRMIHFKNVKEKIQ